MPQLIGVAVLTALGASAATATAFGGFVGSLIVTGALTGVQLLLAPKPDIPKPADGKIQIKQAIPPVLYGYGEDRVTPALIASEMKGDASYDVLAFHQGRIESFERFYLHEDPISFQSGADGIVAAFAQRRYSGGLGKGVEIYWRKGETPETAYSQMVTAFPDKWSAAHRGDGVASALVIAPTADAKKFGNRYPFGLPKLSAVTRFGRCWDFRDEDQDPDDEATWVWTSNPVLHLLNFICHHEAGYGSPVDEAYGPTAGFWLAAADRCDEVMLRADGTSEPRYACGGNFTSETPRRGVIEALLRTFDGWLCERGDGSFIVYAGEVHEPDLVITDAHVLDDDIKQNYDEDEKINEVVVKVVSKSHDFNEVEAEPTRLQDEIDAGAIIVRAEAKAEWCRSWPQAKRLAKRDLKKKRAKLRGTLVLNLYGENLTGRRFFWLNLRDRMSTRMVRCEVADLVDNSLEDGTFRCDFKSVDPTMDDWNAALEEGRPPPVTDNSEDEEIPVPSLPTLALIRETISGVPVVKISATNPPVEGWPDLGLTGWYRKVGSADWRRMMTPDEDLQVLSDIVEDGEYEVQTAFTGGGGGESDRSPTATISVASDNIAPGTPRTPSAALRGDAVTVDLSAKSARNDTHFYSLEARRWTPAQANTAAFGVVVDTDPQPGPVSTLLSWIETPGPGVHRYGFRAFNRSAVPSEAFAVATPDIVVPGVVGTETFSVADQSLDLLPQLSGSGGVAGAGVVSSGKARSSGTSARLYRFPRIGTLRHFMRASLQANAGSTATLLAVRAMDGNNYVGVYWTSGSWFFLRRVAGVNTSLTTVVAPLPAVGTIIELEANDAHQVRFSAGGSVILPFTAIGDAALNAATADRVGFRPTTTAIDMIDNIEYGVAPA